MSKLRITEIFFSLQGETRTMGIPTVFVRLTGCPLRCHYCDSAYAFSGGKLMSLSEIIQSIQTYSTRYVTVTGGEPLAQKECLNLLSQLCDLNYCVSLETSGALDISSVDARVIKVMDVKTPGSGELSKNRLDNFQYLTKQDQIKFVICNRGDYEFAVQCCRQHELLNHCEILFSPSFEQLSATDLANWIIQDAFPVRMQIQLHKYLWGDVPGK